MLKFNENEAILFIKICYETQLLYHFIIMTAKVYINTKQK